MRHRNRVGALALAAVFGLSLMGGPAFASDEVVPSEDTNPAATEVAASPVEEVTNTETPEPASVPEPEFKTEPVIETPVVEEAPAPEPIAETPAVPDPAPAVESTPDEPDNDVPTSNQPVNSEPAPAPDAESTVLDQTASSEGVNAEEPPNEEVPPPAECRREYSAQTFSHNETRLPNGGLYGWAGAGQEHCEGTGVVVLYITGDNWVPYDQRVEVDRKEFDMRSPAVPVSLDYLPPKDGKSYQFSYSVYYMPEPGVLLDFVSVVGGTIAWGPEAPEVANGYGWVDFDSATDEVTVEVEGDVYVVDSQGNEYWSSDGALTVTGPFVIDQCITYTAHPTIEGQTLGQNVIGWEHCPTVKVEIKAPTRSADDPNTIVFDNADGAAEWYWGDQDSVMGYVEGTTHQLQPGETLCFFVGVPPGSGVVVENLDLFAEGTCFTYEEQTTPTVPPEECLDDRVPGWLDENGNAQGCVNNGNGENPGTDTPTPPVPPVDNGSQPTNGGSGDTKPTVKPVDTKSVSTDKGTKKHSHWNQRSRDKEELASTGADGLLMATTGALGLLVAGAGTVLVSRRRSAQR